MSLAIRGMDLRQNPTDQFLNRRRCLDRAFQSAAPDCQRASLKGMSGQAVCPMRGRGWAYVRCCKLCLHELGQLVSILPSVGTEWRIAADLSYKALSCLTDHAGIAQ